MKAAIIIVVVVAMLVGGVLTLRNSRNAGMPRPDVLDRAKLREKEQAAKDQQNEDG